MASEDLRLRYEVTGGDPARVRALTEATGFFRPEEVAIAVELVEERFSRGAASGYEFVFAEPDGGEGAAGGEEGGGGLVGYACFGPIPLTVESWDLYWIAVAPEHQGRGLGRRLLAEAEARIRAAGGRRVYADTSTRPQYTPTRAFYQRAGYALAAELPDFYAPGDGKAVFSKVLGARA